MGVVLRLNQSFGDSTLPEIKRDELLVGAGGGVLFLGDFSNTYSWPSQSAPTDSAVVHDLSDNNDASIVVLNGAPVLAGGGMDFNNVAGSANVASVKLPAAVTSNIWNGGGANEKDYAVCMYGKFIAKADWDTDASVEAFVSDGKAYNVGESMILLALNSGTTGQLSARRGIANGSANQLNFGDFDDQSSDVVTQVLWWKKDGVFGASYRSGLGSNSATMAASQISHDYSARQIEFGHTSIFGGDPRPLQRLYRMYVEDLSLSGRDPEAVALADWERVSENFS